MEFYRSSLRLFISIIIIILFFSEVHLYATVIAISRWFLLFLLWDLRIIKQNIWNAFEDEKQCQFAWHVWKQHTCSLSDILRLFFPSSALHFFFPIRRTGRPRDSGRTSDFPVSSGSRDRLTSPSSLSILRTKTEGVKAKYNVWTENLSSQQVQSSDVSLNWFFPWRSISAFLYSYLCFITKGFFYLMILVVISVLAGRWSRRTLWLLQKYLVDFWSSALPVMLLDSLENNK